MSESHNEPGISDDQLPEDLVGSDDNPLAQELDQDEVGDDVDLLEGKDADESSSESASGSASNDATEDTAE